MPEKRKTSQLPTRKKEMFKVAGKKLLLRPISMCSKDILLVIENKRTFYVHFQGTILRYNPFNINTIVINKNLMYH